MSDRDSPFAAVLDEVIGKPRRELVDRPRDEAIKLLAQSSATVPKEPWSTYVPFPAASELDIRGSVVLPLIDKLAFNGTGTVNERTDDKLALSFSVDVTGIGSMGARVAITYKEDGSSNTTDFAITTTGQKGTNVPTHIKSTRTERIMTPIGGLELKTNLPVLDKVTLKVVHLRPKQDRVELEVEFADLLIPNAIIQVSKKPPENKK